MTTHDDQGAESRLPVVSTGRCTIAHHACECVVERLRRLEAERAELMAYVEGIANGAFHGGWEARKLLARLRADQPAKEKSDRSAHIRAEARRLEQQSQEWLADEVTKNIGAAEEE